MSTLGEPPSELSSWAYDEALRCVKCGFCLSACPTYRESGIETASPRGRLALVRAVAEGRLPLDEEVAGPLDFCLGCRACETACPSGVQYGRVLEMARAALETGRAAGGPRRPAHWPGRIGRSLAFGALLPQPRRLRRLAWLLGGLQRLGFGRPGALLTRLVPRPFRALAMALPSAPTAAQRQHWSALGEPCAPGVRRVAPAGRPRYRVAFFPGCVMDALYLPVNLATVQVLVATGCEVLIPDWLTCCGALHAHTGQLAAARRLARHNMAVLSGLTVDAIVNTAGGCGAHLREYGHLLPGDQAAAAMAAACVDLSAWVADRGLGGARFQSVPWTVTYQDSCHLAHGQGVRRQPRQLLAAIPGLRLVEMAGADQCCGSAGVYNLTQPDMSAAVLARKMQAITATGAQVVVTANPGCHLQLAAGCLGLPAAGRPQVRHLAEVLAASIVTESL